MNIERIAMKVAEQYSREHTYRVPDLWGGYKEYKMELTLDDGEEYGPTLWQTSWPEYEAAITVPVTWGELINLKMREQLFNASGVPGGIGLRYYFEVMRAVDASVQGRRR